jgi:general secretion pathway protein K
VPLQEARLSTFLAANRNVAQVEDASTDTADAFLSGQITDQQGLLNLRNLAGDKQVDATAQRQFAPVRLPGPAAPAADSWRRQCCWPRRARAGRTTRAAAAKRGPAGLVGLPQPSIAALAPHVTLLPVRTLVNLNTASAVVLVPRKPGHG